MIKTFKKILPLILVSTLLLATPVSAFTLGSSKLGNHSFWGDITNWFQNISCKLHLSHCLLGTATATGNFPTTLNNFQDGDIINAGDWNHVESAIGTTTEITSTNFRLAHINIQTNASGTLPVANGGTATTTLTLNNVILGNGTSPVQFVAPGTANNLLTSNGTTWISSTVSGLGFSFGGDGSDGTVVQNTSTTLTRDMYYTNLTVSTSTVVNTGGFRIFVSNALVVNGTIQRNGNNGGNATNASSSTHGSAGTAGAALSGGTLSTNFKAGVAGTDGADGGVSNASGNNASSASSGGAVTNSVGTSTFSGIAGADGGTDGTHSVGTGGPAGSAGTIATTTNAVLRNPITGIYFRIEASSTQLQVSPSPGGSGGGGSGASNTANTNCVSGAGGGGGGGGSPAGPIQIFAKTITVGSSGIISAIGGTPGNGGNGSAATRPVNGICGGGGGGAPGQPGNGGVIILIYQTLTNNGSISVAGGPAGNAGTGGVGAGGGGTGGTPAASSTGNSGTLIQIQTPQ